MINEFNIMSLSTHTPTLLHTFKDFLMHSRNLAFYSLYFTWEINPKVPFPLLQALKTVWLLGNDNGFQTQCSHIIFHEIDRTQLNMSNLTITRSPSVNLIPLRQQVIENWTKWCNTHPQPVLWEQQRWVQWDSLFIVHKVQFACHFHWQRCTQLTDLKFSADRVFYSIL